jgi:LPXTG-motif cell wall-anchored protein
MRVTTRSILGLLCVGLTILLAGAAAAQPTVTTEVRSGEVIWVSGNSLVVRGEAGNVKEFNVPDDFRFDMDGKKLSVHELKPGMKITARITTTTTPINVTVTEIRQAEVVKTLGSTIIVRGQDGQIRKFTADDLKNIKVTLTRDGKSVSAYDLREGDRVSATVTTQQPPEMMTSQQLEAVVQAPPAPKPAPAPKPVAAPVSAPEPPPAQLPKTGSSLPLLGLAGLISVGFGVALTAIRKLWLR